MTTEWPEWEKAMKVKLAQLEKMGTWKLTSLLKDHKPMGCRWVFSVKLDEAGNLIKFKAHLVAKGYSQIPGQDFDQTFAPVICLDSLRNTIAITSIHDVGVPTFHG